jgi:hypothetical protein
MPPANSVAAADRSALADQPDSERHSGGQPSAEVLRAVAEAVRPAFPRPSHATELVLIDVDPRRLHAFWNVSLEHVQEARAELADGGAAPLILRVTAIEEGGERPVAHDVEVQGLQSQTYVEIWDEPRRYRARLGLRRDDGMLAALVESNVLALPAIGPAAASVHEETSRSGEGAAADGGVAAEAAAELPLETMLAGSSFALGREQGGLELSAELHVFGRARIGAELHLFGRRVTLRPDGSFSVTRPLPHGSAVMKALLADFAASAE